MIAASAIKIIYNGNVLIFTGKKHIDCFKIIHQFGIKAPFKEELGFITDKMQFLDRRMAYWHAAKSEQLKNVDENIGRLYDRDIL